MYQRIYHSRVAGTPLGCEKNARVITGGLVSPWLPHALLLTCLTLVAGCGLGGPQLGNVTGTVTLDGKAVPGALVTFVSKEADGTSSFGKTNAQGKFQLEFSTERKGAMLGAYIVEITTKKMSKSDMPDDGSGKEAEFVAIPKHYKRGTLTAEVKSGNNVCDFPLTSKPN